MYTYNIMYIHIYIYIYISVIKLTPNIAKPFVISMYVINKCCTCTFSYTYKSYIMNITSLYSVASI